MTNQTSHEFEIRDLLTIPGHTASAVFVHQTRELGLHCEGCRWSGGGFKDRAGRDALIADAWQKHLDYVATGAVIEHGRAENVTEKVCACVTCFIAWRKTKFNDAVLCRREYRPGHRDSGQCGFPLNHPPLPHGGTYYQHGNEQTGWWWNTLLPASCGNNVNHEPHVTDLGKWCDGLTAPTPAQIA